MSADPYVHLTELAGSPISDEQLQRMVNRYQWAKQFCEGRQVLETACGSGQGLSLLANASRRFVAGDFSPSMIGYASNVTEASLARFDAQRLPFRDTSFDVIVMFEALYYLPAPDDFFTEAGRVLRPGGTLLLATANCDLYDFNPSPFSHQYFGADRLQARLSSHGFDSRMYGDHPVTKVSARQRILRPIKALVVRSGLFPKTAGGKLWMKRLVFGRMRPMPVTLDEHVHLFQPPVAIPADRPDYVHKVILCAATKKPQ